MNIKLINSKKVESFLDETIQKIGTCILATIQQVLERKRHGIRVSRKGICDPRDK